MNKNHEVTVTLDIFGSGPGEYYYTVDLSEVRPWRIRPITTRLGCGQTETMDEALVACRRIINLIVPDSGGVDAAPRASE